MPTDERIEVLVDDGGAVGLDDMVQLSGLTRGAIEELAEGLPRRGAPPGQRLAVHCAQRRFGAAGAALAQ